MAAVRGTDATLAGTRNDGWVSYTAEDDSHLTDSQREGIRQREARKG